MKKIKNIILNNSSLKILSLVLAIVVWFYIIGELNRLALKEEMGLKGPLPYKIIAKTLPVLADIRGDAPFGYSIDKDKVIITPQVCNVIGPKRLLDKISFIKTIPIDMSGVEKTIIVRTSLKSPARGIKIVDDFVTLAIPVEKVGKK